MSPSIERAVESNPEKMVPFKPRREFMNVSLIERRNGEKNEIVKVFMITLL